MMSVQNLEYMGGNEQWEKQNNGISKWNMEDCLCFEIEKI